MRPRLSAGNEKQVGICHRTASTSNPYVLQSPAVANNGDLKGGHLDHTGPVYFVGISGKWGDIIPPYTYLDPNGVQQVFPGYNWDAAGQAIFQHGCSLTPGPSLPVVPLLKCVEPGTGGGFLAHFGYANPNSTETEIPLGDDNFIQPSSADGGQSTTFAPGRLDDAFVVDSNGPDITWTLLGNDVTASADSTPCRASITVVKLLQPSDDDGRFALKIDGDTQGGADSVGNGGTTGTIGVDPGSHTVSESGAGSTSLDDYDTQINCVSGSAQIASGTGDKPERPRGSGAVGRVHAHEHPQSPRRDRQARARMRRLQRRRT